MITILINFAITAITSGAVGYALGRGSRHNAYRAGRWDGLEEGYADAMRDGWTGPGPSAVGDCEGSGPC